MKFFNLLKKELGELLTAQAIITVVAMMLLLMLMGNLMQNTVQEAIENEYTVSISDRDNTEFTNELMKVLEESGAIIKEFDTEGDDYPAILNDIDQESLVIIPEGFTETLESGGRPELISVSAMGSAAVMSNITNDNSGAVGLISQCISNTFAERAGLTAEEVALLNAPVILTENTVVNKNTANIGASTVMTSIMTKNMILPIIVFVLIMFTSQMLMSAISNEKIDKTLETLLSAPVSRTAILGAKMLAAAIIALLNAVFYMIGFSSLMKGTADSVTEGIGDQLAAQFISTDVALEKLGLTLSAGDYILVGLQLFLTIMICLSISLMLGALVNDPKQSQTMMMPLMMMAVIPYIISMLADINSLPTVFRLIVYAIPFTHTFSAMNNIMFGHMGVFFGGLIYQLIAFIICMFFALRLFNSDKILTVSLNLGQKSRFKKNTSDNE